MPSLLANYTTPGYAEEERVIRSDTLIIEIGVPVTLTSAYLSALGDPNQIHYSIPESNAYVITVNGVTQNNFTQADINSDWVRIQLTESACFDNHIPVQATDGLSSQSLSLAIAISTSCENASQAKRISNPWLPGLGILVTTSGLGLFSKKKNPANDNASHPKEAPQFDATVFAA